MTEDRCRRKDCVAGLRRVAAAGPWTTVALMVAVISRNAEGQAAPASDTGVAARALATTITAGRQIFHGPGTCFACHGAKLEGTALAPTLRAHKWKNGDGTLAAIVHIITTGVPNTAMVSHPGGISDAQVKQVAAYVLAVSKNAVSP